MRSNFYWRGREWPYKNVEPKIVCEKYMVDESGNQLKDYKIFCFNGEPRLVQVDYDRFTNHRRNLYDLEWNYLHASIGYPSDPQVVIPKPQCLDGMLSVARRLSEGFTHVRVDLYNINGQVYFGELTLYHGSGFETFLPNELGHELGRWIDLPGLTKRARLPGAS